MNRARAHWLVPALFIGWLFFVLASFFTVQKPFTAGTAAAVGQVLLNLLVASWLLLVALGLGWWLLAWLRLDNLPLGEQVIFGAGLGLGALGLLSLAVGLVGLFNRPAAYVITLILTAAAFPPLRRIGPRLLRWRPAMRPNRWMLLYLSIYALLALLLALLPPTGWDSLFYHLTGPKLYLQAGRITGHIDVPHFNFPSLMEMLFAWAMLLRGDIAAKLLHTAFGLLLAGLVYLTAARLLSRRAAWPAVIIFASMPMVATLAGWAYNDLALAFYQLAAIYAITNYELRIAKEKQANDNPSFVTHYSLLVLGGISAGLAMGLKYTSFVTPLFGVALITFYAFRNPPLATRHPPPATRPIRNSQLAIRSVAAFGLPALLVAAPWYLKNWLFTGNPVYPFLFGVFDGQFWDAFRAEWYAAAGTGVGWQPLTLLGLPWLLTLGINDANFWDGRTGPLLLLFLPLVIWAGLSRRFGGKSVPLPARLLLLYVLAHFAVWTLGVIWTRNLWQSRLLLPALAALAPITGWVWANLPGLDLPRFSLSRFVNIAVAFTLALTLVDAALFTLNYNPLPVLAGLESRADYLTRRLGAYYPAMETINRDLPPSAKVVFLWEPRSYYCAIDCRPDSILDEFAHRVQQYGSAEAIAQYWQADGVTHVLVHRDGLNFMRQHQPGSVNEAVFEALLQNHLDEVRDIAGAYQIYALR